MTKVTRHVGIFWYSPEEDRFAAIMEPVESAKVEQREGLLDQVVLGRLGTPEDVASAVLYLASEEASYVTGQTLNVSGGLYI